MKQTGSKLSRLTDLVQDRWLSGGKRRDIPTYSPPQGFGEAAQFGLADLEARIPPRDAATQPANAPHWQSRKRLTETESAGGGLVRQSDGSMRPHYWGHRERLRKRFLSGGHAVMPEYELLELILFNAIERIDVKPLAKRLLAAFGDLNGVIAASERNILRVDGASAKVYLQLRIAEAFAHRMGQAKILDREILSSWTDVVSYCRTTMAHRDTEQFRVLFLDRRNRVIADEAQGEGTVDHVPVYPREVARRALELNASALILVHNHPSGDPTPSGADIEMTAKIVAACGALEIVIHDHMIIGKEEEVSFRSLGLIEDGAA
ncbi:DNA repair protein RadC [Jannaschia faecimaris]|uniref:DNA repair protein RadC n=1 Tax=Jannaschia faecimaris TaxID=1244108 RepID=A0A1H3PJK8_9RHOB|nr:DNA repair protein RadC [Jannaschia faecimaris]SDZ01025.1 DNA repair protein RadC [Jannaschia faecimaris]